ncbi:MAG TPA: glycerol-3-phosphate dehydrogenase/oxidase [Chthoniobacteraceae bacterium]|nr:glycerol-3-phosphate dehydrogenase/oxidase [Chthoniobacteraceae bacterium]
MTRAESLAAIDGATEPWDVCVIGGGATGLGSALDAAARGYRTVLVERHDFAKGTSSRSTKLIHGGVRYLRQGRIPLVLEALRERGILYRNAPHLVHPLEFIIPARTAWETPFYAAGLALYDLLAGTRGLGRSRILSKAEVMERLPGLDPKGLRHGIAYTDGQFDDARLAIALAQTVADHGGTVLNYSTVLGLLKQNRRVSGVRIRDDETGAERDIPARVVINATGVFTDSIRRMDEPGVPPVITASQGSHVVLPPECLGGTSALMIPRTSDGRILFGIPWHGRLILGTTDHAVKEITAEPRPMDSEIDFILSTASRFLAVPPERSQILSMYAGLRPLVNTGRARGTAALSREHTILIAPSGLVTITGGKWTTYRKMAQDTIDRAAHSAGLPPRACRTEALPLRAPESATGPAIHPRLLCTGGEVMRAVREEMARTVEDILARRTRSLLLDAAASIEAAPTVARLMAVELGRDAAWAAHQVAAYTSLARNYLPRA